MRSKSFILCVLIQSICFSQTLTGRVIDNATKLPVETASIYFDNTTIGTTTNTNGEFSITYTDAVQSPLIISYLGYEKVTISDYRAKDKFNIELIEATNTLDEVLIEYDDGLTRKQKLRMFRKEFLGSSKYGRSCSIKNEDDLILRYNRRTKSLSVHAKAPIIITNKALQYEISYEIIAFEAVYRYINTEENVYNLFGLSYQGHTFYKSLGDLDKSVIKKREKVYKGSIQHFFRAIYNKNLKKEGYSIFSRRFKVKPWDYFTVSAIENSTYKKVTLKSKVDILYKRNKQSVLEIFTPELYVDKYGNYTPINGLLFSGYMGNLRLGDTLPLDYGLDQ